MDSVVHQEKIGSRVGENVGSKWLTLFGQDMNLHIDVKRPTESIVSHSELRRNIFEYFSHVVPSTYTETSVSGILKAVSDNKLFTELIIQPLEYFLCGKNPLEGFMILQEFNQPAKFCGKVFNVGDPTFSCKDCAADPTCVFCNDCFQQSVHKTHKYRLHASSGTGGYCDCGDVEAWRRDPACATHRKGSNIDSDENPFEKLPQDIQQRAIFLLSFLLQYCVDLLCWVENDILPEELSLRSSDDHVYSVMLFNDEAHTYDEVITTLERAIKCSRQEAFRFAAVVDKEGRSLIFSGAHGECKHVQQICEQSTSRNGKAPLKCEIMHRDVVAHQIIAIELMAWLNKLVEKSDGLRRLLCLMSVEKIKGRPECLLDQVILADTALWKVARSSCHQLFMNAVLMDTYGRAEFAVIFAKNYKRIMKDFIKDDHEHAVSVASMSVQIFTVPSLAKMLILKHNLLFEAFETYWEEIQPVLSSHGYINFQTRLDAVVNVKRVDFILSDIRYVLRHRPDNWTPELRTRFLQALDVFFKILKAMQGMDPVVRKTLAHISFEPNWESGFSLQLWIMPTLALALSWCTSDEEVYRASCLKAVNMLRRMLPALDFTCRDHLEVEPGFPLVDYDITFRPASVHMALSRFLAGLLTSCMKFKMSIETAMGIQTFGNQKVSQMDVRKQYLSMVEYPLRTLVLSAQVSAQMWRRNGYAILHQVSYYQNVRCVSEMYDRDIIMLQAGAAVMEPDYFLTVMLDKYNLLDWVRSDYHGTGDEDQRRQTLVIGEEFLLTLLAVLSERHVLGVSNVSAWDILRREVIHRLSLGPSSRSDLVKSLPCKDPDDDDECNFESELDAVLKEVADYKKPGVTGKGLFELKPEFYNECSQFFYHFSRAEQSKALEQRKKALKKSGPSLLTTPQTPPEFAPAFGNILQLFCCGKMSKVIAVVLMRALKDEVEIISDIMLEEVLHIIGIGLKEVGRKRQLGNENQLRFLNTLTDLLGVVDGKPVKIQVLLEDLMQQKNSQEYSSLVKWVVELMHEELSLSEEHVSGVPSSAKRRMSQTGQLEEDEKERKTRVAREKREKVMAQMAAMQKAFIKSNASQFLEDQEKDGYLDQVDGSLVEEDQFIAIGSHRSAPQTDTDPLLCILCQETQDVGDECPLVLSALVQRSKVLSKCPGKILDATVDYNPLYAPLDRFTGTHVSSCGHVMHSKCWQKYFDSKEGRAFLSLQRNRSCVDIAKSEYLCPLCSALCNSALPLLPCSITESEDERTGHVFAWDANSAVDFLQEQLRQHSHDLSEPSQGSMRSVFKKLIQNFVSESDGLAGSAEEMIKMFAQKIYLVGLGVEPLEDSPRVPCMGWSSCSYTIQAVERILALEKKFLFGGLSSRQAQCLRALVQFAAANSRAVSPVDIIKRHCLKLLNVFAYEFTDGFQPPSIADLDVFGILVNLRLALPSLQVCDEMDSLSFFEPVALDQAVLHLCFIAYMVQLLLHYAPESGRKDGVITNEVTASFARKLTDLCSILRKLARFDQAEIHPEALLLSFLDSMLPFLRCCALFYSFLTGIPGAKPLQQDKVNEMTVHEEYHVLCKYLALPDDLTKSIDLPELSDGRTDTMSSVCKMITRWCLHERVQSIRPSEAFRCHATLQPLIALPHDYSVLISQASGFKCPAVGDPSRCPALCLLCGVMLCSQCYGCQSEVENKKQLGSCSAHTRACGDGVGVLLRVRECEVVLLYNQSKGCFKTSPYLDEYGEPDYGFRRGNPLFLCEERYENLQKLWLSHGIPEEVARAMEASRGLLTFDWSSL